MIAFAFLFIAEGRACQGQENISYFTCVVSFDLTFDSWEYIIKENRM